MSSRPTMIPLLEGLTCGESYILIGLAVLLTVCTFLLTKRCRNVPPLSAQVIVILSLKI